MTTPLLIEVGDADGTVFWHQGVELYNAARRAKKDVVLLVYGGEDHGLRQKANQIDYHRRIMEWFGHYLKGDPARALDHQRRQLPRQGPRRAQEPAQTRVKPGSDQASDQGQTRVRPPCDHRGGRVLRDGFGSGAQILIALRDTPRHVGQREIGSNREYARYMPRYKRIREPGLLRHVMSRGNGRMRSSSMTRLPKVFLHPRRRPRSLRRRLLGRVCHAEPLSPRVVQQGARTCRKPCST